MEISAVVLGDRIAAAREHRGWSRSDLARKAHLDPSYVTRIEEARYKRPGFAKIRQLADALGIRVTELIDPMPVGVSSSLAAELAAMFGPDEAQTVAEILKRWARHDEPTRRFLARTMRPLVSEIPEPEPR